MSLNGSWVRLALRADIAGRSLRVALVVGSILALINHGDKIGDGSLDTESVVKIGLTYLVPYAVSTWAAVQTARAGLSKHG